MRSVRDVSTFFLEESELSFSSSADRDGLTAGLLVLPTWADNNFWGSPAAAVYEDTTPPEDPPSNPLDEGLTAGEHDHSHDDEDVDPADVQPLITVAQEDAER